ncbi:MAG: tRNA (adenosine(37)-N6)-dimethylallyltransferase MiaA [Dehalococcoidia bacterium]|nr:tRNA (adenosine(37)-N6)-dimethylallyltransferase MiaA [Dehalococcoidia bacterium]
MRTMWRDLWHSRTSMELWLEARASTRTALSSWLRTPAPHRDNIPMPSARQANVLAIVGPTASGKSRLGMEIAQVVGGEIIGADSRQVYRHMDIGTAKPPVEDRQRVRHHLVDIIDPSDEYSVAVYIRQARKAISDVLSRSGVPIVVGGTGQYVWALLEGWNVPEVSPNPLLRDELQARMAREGLPTLVKDLEQTAPAAAKKVDLANPRRVIRALELALQDPNSEPEGPTRTPPPFQATVIGIEVDRARLYERINARVDAMFEAGWVGEVEHLLNMGYGPGLSAMSSLGYREICEYLRGEATLKDAVETIKTKTRRFARQQGAWFRTNDERIRWFSGEREGLDQAVEHACDSVGKRMDSR